MNMALTGVFHIQQKSREVSAAREASTNYNKKKKKTPTY